MVAPCGFRHLAATALVALAAFAYLLTRIESDTAERAYAAYGGVYIAASIAWIWLVEGQRALIAGI